MSGFNIDTESYITYPCGKLTKLISQYLGDNPINKEMLGGEYCYFRYLPSGNHKYNLGDFVEYNGDVYKIYGFLEQDETILYDLMGVDEMINEKKLA